MMLSSEIFFFLSLSQRTHCLLIKMSGTCELEPLMDCSEEGGLCALRDLELNAYASIVNTLRAQGPLTEEKKLVLKQLQLMLDIPVDRHKAEIRRAVNCEKLSTICYVVSGSLCETSWRKEGRRLINALKRSTPINAYMKIANKVANITAKENEELTESLVGNRTGTFQEIGILLPPSKADANYTENVFVSHKPKKELYTRDAFTSTEDLCCNPLQQAALDETKSFVYLPGGTMVHLERDYDAGSQNKPENIFFSSTLSSHTTPLLKKHQSCNIATVDSPFVIKEVFRPNSIQAFQKQSRSPVKKKEFGAPQLFQQSAKSINVANEPNNITDDLYVGNTSIKLDKGPIHQETEFSSKPPTVTDVLKLKTSLPRDHTEQFTSNNEKAGSIIPQAPVPPEHLYAVGASRTKTSARNHASATWATKNTTTTHTTKIKKRIHKPPMQHLQRKIGINSAQSRISWSTNDNPAAPNQFTGDMEKDVIDLTRNNESSGKRHAVGIGSETLLHRNIPINDSLFLNTKDCPPQKVFRPSICMTGVSLKTQKHELASFYSESEPSQCASVETGLAPVSSIMSRVSSPAEPMSEHNSDTNTVEQQSTVLSSSGKVKMIRTSSNSNQFGKFRTPPSSNIAHGFYSKPPVNPLSKSLPSDQLLKMCHDKDHVTEVADGVTFEIKSLSNVVPATTFHNATTKSWINESEFEAGGVVSGCNKTKIMDSAPVRSSVSLAASGLCALAAGAGVGCDSKTSPKLTGEKNPGPFECKQLPISGNNIIKVAPRQMQSKVTQIQSHRNKPSIIVVHRPPGGKPVTASPAKFLEVGSNGMPKPFTQVKTLSSVSKAITVPISSTAAIAKPVPTKIVSVATNVRTVSGKSLATNFHKVITKGKMQQLVLKPTSSVVASNRKPSSSINKPTIKEENLCFSETSSLNTTIHASEALRSQPTMPMHAATTIKALMAIQMGSQSNTEIEKVNATEKNVGVSGLKPIFKQKPNLIAVSTPKTSKVILKKPSDEEFIPITSEEAE
uniref:BRCA2-interacting transcriptional repressor EMSY n=1 Tax=Phallusia mammillata TaxID=59560 RepID=A0A6F9DCQ4_9ASCI|nr:BRCA2-interacting transcriptional repressor EMSY [Phallusia mammillata]